MSDIVGDLPPIGPGDGLPQVIDFLQKLRVYIQTREPQADSVGDALEKLLLRRDLVSLGVLQTSGSGSLSYTGGGGSGTGSGGAGDEPDLTAPPTPANLRASSLLRGAYIEIDAPVYTVGHGNAWTNYFVAQYSGTGPLPTRENAVKVGQAAGASTMYVHAAPIGARLHIWATHVTVDGVESAEPAGGINGVQVTIGKIGNADLGDLIVQAQNLADGTVTPGKLSVQIGGGNLVGNSSFEADSNGDDRPDGWSGYNSNTIFRVPGRRGGYALRATFGGGAPTWGKGINGGAFAWRPNTTYVVSFWARASYGSVAYPMNLRWNLGPVTTEWISNPDPDATVWKRYVARITWGASVEPAGPLYIAVQDYDFGANVSGYAEFDDVQVEEGNVPTAYAPRPDEILPGTITATEIADDSVTTPKLVAGSVVTSKIAAGAIQAQHLLIAPTSLVIDPTFAQGTAGWSAIGSSGYFVARYHKSHPMVPSPALLPTDYAAVFAGRDAQMLTRLKVEPGEQYKASVLVYKPDTLPSTGWVALFFDANGSYWAGHVAQTTSGAPWFRVEDSFTVPAGAVTMSVAPWNGQAHGGTIGSWFSNLQVEKKSDYSLIVDGAILARHLSANVIVAGSAAIANGAIGNAMIGNAAIDDAKIASLSAAKITFGEMSGERIAVSSLHGNRIAAASITADALQAWSVGATQAILANASINNAKITDLSAEKINVGTLNVDRIADGDITQTHFDDQFTSEPISSGGTVLLSVGVSVPGGSWAGEGQASLVVFRSPYTAGTTGLTVSLEVFNPSSGWTSVRSATVTTPASSAGFTQTVHLSAPWAPPSSATAWRVVCTAPAGVSYSASGMLFVVTRRK